MNFLNSQSISRKRGLALHVHEQKLVLLYFQNSFDVVK